MADTKPVTTAAQSDSTDPNAQFHDLVDKAIESGITPGTEEEAPKSRAISFDLYKATGPNRALDLTIAGSNDGPGSHIFPKDRQDAKHRYISEETDFEGRLAMVQDGMEREGYSPKQIQSWFGDKQVHALPPAVDKHISKHFFDEGVKGIESVQATWEVWNKLKEQDPEGVGPFEWSAVRRRVLELAVDRNVTNLGAASTWWRRKLRDGAREGGRFMSEGFLHLQHGFMLIDGLNYWNNLTRFELAKLGNRLYGGNFTEEKQAELYAKLIPDVRVKDIRGKEHIFGNDGFWGQTFGPGVGAATFLLRERVLGRGEAAFGDIQTIVGSVMDVLGNPIGKAVVTSGEDHIQSGRERGTYALHEVPALASALHEERLTFRDVIEVQFDPEELEEWETGMKKSRKGKFLVEWVFPVADVATDILGDTAIVSVGVGGTLIPKILRTAARVGLPKQVAKEAAKKAGENVHRMTYKAAQTAKDEAKAYYEGLRNSAKEELARSGGAVRSSRVVEATAGAEVPIGGSISFETAQKLEAAAKNYEKWRLRVATWEQSDGAYSPLVLRTAQRHPTDVLDRNVVEMHIERAVKPVQPADARKAIITEAEGRAVSLRKQAGVAKQAGRTKDQAKLEEMAKGAEFDILEGHRIPTGPRQKTVEVPIGRRRTFDELAREQHTMRKRELQRGYNEPIDWSDPLFNGSIGTKSQQSMFNQRAAFGPSNVEEAGDAMNYHVRTGGVAIEDVSLKPWAPEFNTDIPGNAKSLIDFRAGEAQNVITTLEKKLIAETGGVGRGVEVQLSLGLDRASGGLSVKEKILSSRIASRKGIMSRAKAKGPKKSETKADFDDRIAGYEYTIKTTQGALAAETSKVTSVQKVAALKTHRLRLNELAKAHTAAGQEKEANALLSEMAEVQRAIELQQLPQNTYRMIARELDMAQRNLGDARNLGNKAGIVRTEKEIKALKKELINLENKVDKSTGELKAVMGGDKEVTKKIWDNRLAQNKWLPREIVKDTSALAYNNMIEAAGGALVRGLYPGSFYQSMLTSRLGMIGMPLREPMRVMETFAPGQWERVRTQYLRYHQAMEANTARYSDLAVKYGLAFKRSKWNPRKHFSRYAFDPKKDEMAFNILNSKYGSKEMNEAIEAVQLAYKGKEAEGIIDFTQKVRGMTEVWAERLGISDTDRYITGYMHHILDFEKISGNRLPAEYFGMSANSEMFIPFLLKRSGDKAFKKSAVSAFDVLNRGTSAKLHLQPMYKEMLSLGKELEKSMPRGGGALNFYMNSLVNHMKGKPTNTQEILDGFYGPLIKRIPGIGKRWSPGAGERSLINISSLTWASMLAGNPRYGPMQILQGVATTSGRFGLFRTIQGIFRMGSREGIARAKMTGAYQVFQDAMETPMARKLTDIISHIPSIQNPMGMSSTFGTEFYVRGITANASIDMQLAKAGFVSIAEAREAGALKNILFQALRSSEEVNHMFGPMGRPPMLNRLLGRGGATFSTQFLSFIPKQTEEVLRGISKDPGYFMRYMAVSGMLSRMAASELGWDITNYVGFGYVPEAPNDFWQSPAVGMLLEMAEATTNLGRGLESAQKWAEVHQRAVIMATPYAQATQNLLETGRALRDETQINARTGEKIRNLQGVSGPGTQNLFDPQRVPGVGDEGGEASFGGRLKGFGKELQGIRDPIDQDPAPGLGSDLFPTLFSQKPIRRTLHKQAVDRLHRLDEERGFEVQGIIDKFTDAYEDKDWAKMDEVREEMAKKWHLRISSTSRYGSAIEAYALSKALRDISHKKGWADQTIEVFRAMGQEIKP